LLCSEDLELHLAAYEGDDYKKVLNFFEQKSAPQTKSWLRLCLQTDVSGPAVTM